jgi:hypothetical protein
VIGILLGAPASSAVAIAGTIDEQLKAVADFAAVVLALVTFFTTWRASKLARDRRDGIGTFDLSTAGQLAVDGALAVVTFLACAAMASSFSASWTWSPGRWTERSHVLQSLFSVIYLGFVLVLIVQLGLIAGRAIPTRAAGKQRKGAAAPT